MIAAQLHPDHLLFTLGPVHSGQEQTLHDFIVPKLDDLAQTFQPRIDWDLSFADADRTAIVRVDRIDQINSGHLLVACATIGAEAAAHPDLEWGGPG